VNLRILNRIKNFFSFSDRNIPSYKLTAIPPIEEYTLDELASRKGLTIYRKMRQDDMVRACSDLKKVLVLSGGWEFKGDKEQVEFLNSNIKLLNKYRSFYIILKDILTCYDYGFSLTDKVYSYDKETGKIVISKLKTIQPFDVEFNFKPNTDSIESVSIGFNKYPIDKFILYSFQPEFGNPYGQSELKSAYDAWWFKQVIWKFWARYLEKYGSPLKLVKHPANLSDEEKEILKSKVKSASFDGILTLPESDLTNEKFKIELLEPKEHGGSHFREAIENADGRISRALLFPRLFGMTQEKFGSYALAEKQFDIVYYLIEELQKELQEVLNSQLIHELLSYNFDTPNAEIVFKQPRKQPIKDLVEIYRDLVKENIITKTDDDEQRIRNLIGF